MKWNVKFESLHSKLTIITRLRVSFIRVAGEDIRARERERGTWPNMARVERRSPLSIRRKDGLLRYATNASSQCGEDGILEFIFSTVLPPTQGGNPRWVVEVGSWDGKHNSNSYGLLNAGGEEGGGSLDMAVGKWSGLLIEADSARHREAAARYTPRAPSSSSDGSIGAGGGAGPRAGAVAPIVICVEAMVGLEGDDGLESIIAKNAPMMPLESAAPPGVGGGAPQLAPQADELGVLSIDVDGCDYWIWDSLETLKPAVIIIEHNPTIPNHVRNNTYDSYVCNNTYDSYERML